MQERHCNKNCCTPQSGQTAASQSCGQPSIPPFHPKGRCAYALYYQLENITAAANDGIDFPLTAAESIGDFLSDGNQVQIIQPGVYYISYTVNIPADTALTTTLALQANRQNVSGTERALTQVTTAASTSASAETILTVCSPVSIRVVSTSALAITGEEDEVLASLYIQQLA